MMYDENEPLEGPFGYDFQHRQRRVYDAVKAMIPTASDAQVTEFIDAMDAIVEEKTDDLRDRMERRGRHDPDY
jgi:hypothetical protein